MKRTKAEQTRVYNIRHLKELKAAERKQQTLYNKYDNVRVISVNPDLIQIIAWNSR